MTYRPRYDKGDWKAICDICGRERKASELRQRWDGFMVCPDDYEVRHPQDFVRGIADFQAPPFTRPEATDSFVGINYTPTLTDTVTIVLGNTDSYLVNNSDYFLSDYLLTIIPELLFQNQFYRTFPETIHTSDNVHVTTGKSLTDTTTTTDAASFSVQKHLADTTTNTDTGTIFLLDYVDPTYFLDVYVGTLLATF